MTTFVAVRSIRERILKAEPTTSNQARDSVAVRSIRERILKDVRFVIREVSFNGCSEVDPGEDTERPPSPATC